MGAAKQAKLKNWPEWPEGVDQRIEIVTPEQAIQWLQTVNISNRNIIDSRVMRYARDMEAGRWDFNGTAISFDINGILLDGQHRLKACALSNRPFVTSVVRGLPTNARRTMDIGAGRTAAQMAGLDGVQNSAVAAAMARLILLYEKYEAPLEGSTARGPSNAEISDYTVEYQDELQPGAKIGGRCKNLVAPAIAAFCFYEFAKRDEKKALRFFDELVEGGLPNTHPVFHLRERLLQFKNARARTGREEIVALFFKCWVYYREGRPMKHLSWRREGPKAEAFPTID